MAILIAVFATPNAVSSYAMARNYEADYELAGEIITPGTLLSVLTIFVFTAISNSLGWICTALANFGLTGKGHPQVSLPFLFF